MSEPCRKPPTDGVTEMCKNFMHHYYHISNTRPDLLYRLYGPDSTMSVAETVRGKSQSISAYASNQHEVRFLLTSIFDRIQTKLINLSCQHSTSDQLLLTVNGLLKHETSRVEHFFAQTFLLDTIDDRLVIASDILQIYSQNLKTYLLSSLKTKLKSSRIPVGISYPPVINTKLRAKLPHPTPVSVEHEKVGSLFLVKNEAGQTLSSPFSPPSPTDAMMGEIKVQRPHRLEPDTARESGPKSFRSHDWDAFSHNKPPFGGMAFADDLSNNPSQYGKTHKTEEMILNTPCTKNIHDAGERSSKEDGLFLTCFGGKEKHRGVNYGSTLYDYERSEPLKEKANESGAYLRIFGFEPIPDGPPVEWDLSENAVFNQLQAYQETVDRLRATPVPKIRSRTTHPQMEWYQRTVFFDSLPRDVDPASLRRALEATFGEIEEENGIIVASAKKSSIAYVVFKSFESAMAVGRADTWVKGTKIVIQKYRSRFVNATANET